MMNNRKRKDFIGLQAPTSYIPGMGRGATGFTTRSDIGPARDDTDVPDERHSQFKKSKDDDVEDNLNDSNYDEFSGYGGGLCSKDPYDEEDQEADRIYEMIDKHMDERRKDYRERREMREIEKYRRKRPKIEQLFADLKRDLKHVTEEEWKNIPEVGDARNKKQRNPRQEMSLPMPDNLIQQSFDIHQKPRLDGSITSGYQTTGSSAIDMIQVGRARTQLMDNKLNQLSDSVTGQTNVDPKGYLTDLQAMNPQVGAGFTADVGDVKRNRKMLKSMVDTDPTNHIAWLGYVRFEEHFNKTSDAKHLIMQGCEHCPDNEELWLDAVRIMGAYSGKDNLRNAKATVAKALRNIPDSVNLWVKAAELEDTRNKKLIFREGLKEIPDSVKLWKCLIELEEEDEARELLKGAVKCCPTSVEMWLALARLSSPDEARAVLNRARQNIPNDRQIWITAFRLEENAGNEERIPLLVSRAVELLRSYQVQIKRDEWLHEAEESEKAGYPLSAKKIVEHVVGLDVDLQDRKHTWMNDADSFEGKSCKECARSVYTVAVEALSNKKSVWRKAAQFERVNGTRDAYENVLRRAVTACPKAEVLWLMLAKSRWEAGEIDDARMELNRAFTANSNSEEIMLAAMKLESETNQFARARKLLQKALSQVDTPRVWMKCARLEWCLGDLESAHSLLEQATGKYPIDQPKLWMMLGQVREQLAEKLSEDTANIEEIRSKWINKALEGLREGLEKNPKSVELCLVLAEMEERYASLCSYGTTEPVRARSTLERMTVRNINNATMWLARIRLENRAGKPKQAEYLMSSALQKCPNSDILLTENVEMTPLRTRKTVVKHALTVCENSEHLILATAKLFWVTGHYKKAREWVENSLKLEPLFGDAWAYLYRLTFVMGSTEDDRRRVVERCVDAEPRYGEHWTRVAKDVSNWKVKTAQLLEKVAAVIPLPK